MAGLLCFAFGAELVPVRAGTETERFRDTEIRVIRPRYFNKSNRFELGVGLTTVMNESFIYTFMATGLAAYHFNEEFALEGSFAYGLSLDRSDKRVLFDEFDIKTQIFRTKTIAELGLQWTPIYGKWQLASGRLIYFDTFLVGGFGQTGVDWKYDDFCVPPDPAAVADSKDKTIPTNVVKSYPTFFGGGGQRYFVSRTLSYKWDIRIHRFLYDPVDGECSPNTIKSVPGYSATTTSHDSITLTFGVARYF